MRNLKTLTILFRSAHALENVIKSDVLNYDMSLSEFGALEALYHKGTLTASSLTEKVLIAHSSMTYVISRLEQKGLIGKTVDTLDKRSSHIRLTDKGKALMDSIYPLHEASLRNRLDRLTEEEENTLQQLLKKIGK